MHEISTSNTISFCHRLLRKSGGSSIYSWSHSILCILCEWKSKSYFGWYLLSFLVLKWFWNHMTSYQMSWLSPTDDSIFASLITFHHHHHCLMLPLWLLVINNFLDDIMVWCLINNVIKYLGTITQNNPPQFDIAVYIQCEVHFVRNIWDWLK